jgi:hypothetical protein
MPASWARGCGVPGLDRRSSESGLMAIAGWTRTDMLVRYTRAHVSERAAQGAARLNLGAL